MGNFHQNFDNRLGRLSLSINTSDRNVRVLSAAAGRAQLRGAVSSAALVARVERVLGLGSGERLVVAVPRHGGGTDYDDYDPSDIPADQARPGDQAAS